jgi:hypothetical protein
MPRDGYSTEGAIKYFLLAVQLGHLPFGLAFTWGFTARLGSPMWPTRSAG